MAFKVKKTKKSKGLRGTTTHGWGARKKHKGSGHRGGFGMAGTGKRADQKKTLINKKYGNKYFGKQGITSKGTKKKKEKVINLRDLVEKFGNKKEIDLSGYKILGDGEVKRALVIKAKEFSKSAREKIEKVGGKCIGLKAKKINKPVIIKEESEKKNTNNSQKNLAEQKSEKAKETESSFEKPITDINKKS